MLTTEIIFLFNALVIILEVPRDCNGIENICLSAMAMQRVADGAG